VVFQQATFIHRQVAIPVLSILRHRRPNVEHFSPPTVGGWILNDLFAIQRQRYLRYALPGNAECTGSALSGPADFPDGG